MYVLYIFHDKNGVSISKLLSWVISSINYNGGILRTFFFIIVCVKQGKIHFYRKSKQTHTHTIYDKNGVKALLFILLCKSLCRKCVLHCQIGKKCRLPNILFFSFCISLLCHMLNGSDILDTAAHCKDVNPCQT